MDKHLLEHDHLSVEGLMHTVSNQQQVILNDAALTQVRLCRNYLDEKLAATDEKFYGVNTGFGSLCNVQVSHEELGELQENLVRSHACGTGNPVPLDVVRLMLLLKTRSLLYGNSGVAPETVERLLLFYNEGLLPVVYEKGSLGASGDLAPLAHLCLPLIGEGEIWKNGEKVPAAEVLQDYGLRPLSLQAKEGLSLLNGTQFMAAYGCWCLAESEKMLDWAEAIAAMAIDGFQAKLEPFDDRIHRLRNFQSQQQVAANVLKWLKGSDIAHQQKGQVQDPYSFRCIPQVHGASREAVTYVKSVVEREINAVTDNPNIFPESDAILSGGNFHGQPLALVLDHLTLAMSETGSISERRTYKLLSGHQGLPDFLVNKSGLNSGLMIPQYTAAALCSENKQLCTPASADSIVSSNGQEDHVSMGANAAIKAYKVLKNVKSVLAIELLTAAQALDLRRPLRSSEAIEALLDAYRKEVSFIEQDRALYKDMNLTERFLDQQYEQVKSFMTD